VTADPRWAVGEVPGPATEAEGFGRAGARPCAEGPEVGAWAAAPQRGAVGGAS
jgi:hypothetical protein